MAAYPTEVQHLTAQGAHAIVVLLAIYFSGLMQLCPERDLVYKWEKDRDTMNSLQLCIGFGRGVQVTIPTIERCHDILSGIDYLFIRN